MNSSQLIYHVCHVVEEWPHGHVGLANCIYSTVHVLYEPSSAIYHFCHMVEEWPHGQVCLANCTVQYSVCTL